MVTLRITQTEGWQLGPVSGLCVQWQYIYSNRGRWQDKTDALNSLRDRAFQLIKDLGVPDDAIKKIGQGGFVEVAIPFDPDGGVQDWETRLFPWEFLLRAGTRNLGLVVVRHLDLGLSETLSLRRHEKTKTLFLRSSPGDLEGLYSFESEERLVRGSLGLADEEDKFATIITPPSGALSSKVREFDPDLIHITGVDLFQGDRLLRYKAKGVVGQASKAAADTDDASSGFYLAADPSAVAVAIGRDPAGTERVGAVRLAKMLNPENQPLGRIVCVNCYNSSDMAAMMVANGAGAAIGFQDTINDALAERFFASFYQRWRHSEWEVRPAFQASWQGLSPAGGRGSGIVLWSRCSLAPTAVPISKAPTCTKPEPLVIDDNRFERVGLDVRPCAKINYSELHNGEGLFEKFTFYKFEPVCAFEIGVEVELGVGTDSFPYRACFDLAADEPLLDIAKHVNLPLTSRLARSLRETMLSSLRVRVTLGGHDLYHRTHRVKLEPVNEWQFDEEGRSARWLASFVHSQDHAIREIVDRAQKYLMVLRDDPGAGFDGYQQVEAGSATVEQNSPNAALDPGRDPGRDPVDTQVRALWAALSLDLTISYINPPPVFTVGKQRLRTPSDIVEGRRGTCIDLALLFAACLEYIGLYPVIFLLSDHAFPGYWTCEKAYGKFEEVALVTGPPSDGGDGGDPPLVLTQTNARKLEYEEASRYVREGLLVPLETVCLTNREHQRFDDACQQGMDNLRSSWGFEALIDIQRERLGGATPLPITGESG
jgi:hypothetical protein